MDFPDSLTACFGRHLTQQLTDSSTNQLRDNLSYQEHCYEKDYSAFAIVSGTELGGPFDTDIVLH